MQLRYFSNDLMTIIVNDPVVLNRFEKSENDWKILLFLYVLFKSSFRIQDFGNRTFYQWFCDRVYRIWYLMAIVGLRDYSSRICLWRMTIDFSGVRKWLLFYIISRYLLFYFYLILFIFHLIFQKLSMLISFYMFLSSTPYEDECNTDKCNKVTCYLSKNGEIWNTISESKDDSKYQEYVDDKIIINGMRCMINISTSMLIIIMYAMLMRFNSNSEQLINYEQNEDNNFIRQTMNGDEIVKYEDNTRDNLILEPMNSFRLVDYEDTKIINNILKPVNSEQFVNYEESEYIIICYYSYYIVYVTWSMNQRQDYDTNFYEVNYNRLYTFITPIMETGNCYEHNAYEEYGYNNDIMETENYEVNNNFVEDVFATITTEENSYDENEFITAIMEVGCVNPFNNVEEYNSESGYDDVNVFGNGLYITSFLQSETCDNTCNCEILITTEEKEQYPNECFYENYTIPLAESYEDFQQNQNNPSHEEETVEELLEELYDDNIEDILEEVINEDLESVLQENNTLVIHRDNVMFKRES